MIMLSSPLSRPRVSRTRSLTRATSIVAAVLMASSVLSATTSSTQANPTGGNSGTNSFDNMRDGWDSNEPRLKPTDVTSSSFGQVFQTQLKGQLYAQPVIANNVLIAGTEANMIYGLDPATGTILWSRDLGNDNASYPGIPNQKPWPAGSDTVSCGDLLPTIGITSTPVYNPATGSVYFTDKWDDGTNHSNAHYFLHAVDPATGIERPNFPREISGHPSNDSSITFDAFTQLQRPGLLLLDGVVYLGFGSHCDYNGPLTNPPWSRPYRGFIVGVDASSGTQTSMWTTETSVAVGGAGIWQAGTGLMSDGSGRIFFSTGNGLAPAVPTGSTWLAGSAAASVNTFSESIVRLQVQPDRSLAAADFFSPATADLLDLHDLDISSGGPVALPDSFSTSPRLLAVQGKDGHLFLLNRDNLGGRVAMGQTDHAIADLTTSPTVDAHYGRQAVWGGDGGYVYTVDYENGLRAYSFGLAGGKPTLTDAGASTIQFMGFGSGSPIVTSDGTTSGTATVWNVTATGGDGSNGTLHAYDAIPTNGVLNEIFTAPIGFVTKFSTPMTYNGRVYVGTRCSPSATPTASNPCTDGMIWAFGSPTTNLLTGSAADLGSTPVNQTLTGTINLTASTSAAVTITNVTARAPFGVGATSHSLPAGGSWSLPITFNSATAGTFSGLVSVQTDVGTFDFSVRAVATQHELLVTSPKLVSNAVTFPLQPTGIPRTINIQISNMSPTAEQVTGITNPSSPFSINGSVNLPVTLQPAGQSGSSIVLPVVFDPTTAPADGSTATFTSTIGVTGSANLPTQSGCTSCVKLTGTAVIAQPHVTYSTTKAAFGQVAVGRSQTRTFTITNDGNLPITIVKAKPPVSSFTSARPIYEGTTIPPGESVNFDVTFAPPTIGSRQDRYVITPSAGSGLTEISFTGTGVDVPSAPTAVTVLPGTKSISLSWNKTPNSGGLTVTGYKVTSAPGTRGCTTSATITRCTITGLTDGRSYRFAIAAKNALGTSRTPMWTPAIISGAPSAPRSLAVTATASGSSRITWLAPLTTGSAVISKYLIRISADGGRTWSLWTNRPVGPGLSALLSGLVKGTSYDVQVHAANRVGTGVNANLRFIQKS